MIILPAAQLKLPCADTETAASLKRRTVQSKLLSLTNVLELSLVRTAAPDRLLSAFKPNRPDGLTINGTQSTLLLADTSTKLSLVTNAAQANVLSLLTAAVTD